MAEEFQPPDALISATSPAPVAHSPTQPPLDHPTTATKRQRRPSVRLGEIGDPPHESHPRRATKTWRFHRDPSFASKTSKTRPLTNLVNGVGDSNFQDSVDNCVDFAHRKSKSRKPTKRARTNWNKFESATINSGGIIEGASGFPEENENNGEFRELEPEGSESPLLKEQHSPVNSVENMGLQFWNQHRMGNRGGTRVSESNGMLHNEVNSPDEKHSEESVGVREWLSGLGLGKYAPVFEIHEVDDEVLPMLTLEDLKDMGINAVGSRRKMYSSILKLRKVFS